MANNQQQDGVEMETSQAENNPCGLPIYNNNNSSSSSTLARWPLSKYANLIISKKPGSVANGTWQERTAGEPQDMWIQITQRHYIQILHADVLLECCSLSDARGEWRAIRRGHNMLFIITTTNKETSRKFRIRFQSNNQEPAETVAYTCARHLSSYFTLHDADRQGQDGDSQPRSPCTITLKKLAEAVLNPQQAQWPPSYVGVGSVAELDSDLVRFCLMDPNFPSLVQSVENSMRKLMSSDQDF